MAAPGTVIVKCGGEFRGSLKRDGKGPDGTAVMKVRKCESQFQDESYGKDMRVANRCDMKGKETTKYICSVCLKPHDVKS